MTIQDELGEIIDHSADKKSKLIAGVILWDTILLWRELKNDR